MSASILHAQSTLEEQLQLIEEELEFTSEPEFRRRLLQEKEALVNEIYARDNTRDLERRDMEMMRFETQLNYYRGVFSENDERTIVALEHKKLDRVLHGFLQTEFMSKFRELKIEAESLAATFKARAMTMPPQDVARVKKAYIKVADQFNLQLLEIKRDFLDRKKMKLIQHDQSMYAQSLQYRMRALKEMYANDFEIVVAEVTGTDAYSAIPIATILSLVKLAKDFAEYLINAHYEAKRVKEEHLNMYLIEPYRFRDWMEIETLEGDIYSGQDVNQYNDAPYQEDFTYPTDLEDMDPFEDEAPVSLKPGRIHGSGR
jgi:hypothetical protein